MTTTIKSGFKPNKKNKKKKQTVNGEGRGHWIIQRKGGGCGTKNKYTKTLALPTNANAQPVTKKKHDHNQGESSERKDPLDTQ